MVALYVNSRIVCGFFLSWWGGPPQSFERSIWDCVGFYTIPYIQAYIQSWHTWPAQKEATSCTRFNVQDWRWIGTIFYSDPCELILLHGFLRWYLYMFKISCRAEVVTSLHRSVTATPGLTSAGCHFTCLVSDLWSDAPKVPLYGT